MLNETNSILSQAAAPLTRSIAEFLPKVLALIVILAFTLAIAWCARLLVRRFLQRVDFNTHMDRWGFSAVAEWSPSHSPAKLMGTMVFWFIAVIGFAIALSALDATLTSSLMVRLVYYLPNLVAAVIILGAGVIFARFAARGVLISAVNLQIQWARLLSLGVKWLVLVLAGAMALEHIGIGGQIVLLAFGILFGGIVLALALAVGLGSKEMVSRSLERQAGKHLHNEETAASRYHGL